MPSFDKPDWIQHAGAAILGVDIDGTGERLATCGSDSKVRIWSMRPVLSEAAELDAAVPKQLAALSDSTMPVNCVRFAPGGRLLTAGSDDWDAYVFELREGRGSALFGSGEAANIENWKLRLRLRGHESNVADLAWAPDSRRLATASLDSKVKIWDASTGQCLRTLDGHEGHVKGVAWDPFDMYLASQGDREVIVWRLEDGQPACRLAEPFVGAPIVSFALRPSWSPDGQVLALPNGYYHGVHTVQLIQRNVWSSRDFTLVGHRGPVTAVRYNPHLYVMPSRRGGGGEEAAAATAGNDEEAGAGGVAGVGSTDKSFSVWHPAVTSALLVGRGFFDRMVNDLAWGPDGRVLVVASQDGGVTVMVFKDGELGRRVSEAELQELLSKLYGDPRLRNQKEALTAAPDLLQLETRARVDMEREERLSNRLGPGAPAAAPPPPQVAAAAAARGLPGPRPQPQLPQAAAVAAAATAPPPAATSNEPSAQPVRPGQPATAPVAMVTGTQRAASPAKPGPTAGGRAGAAASIGRDPELPPSKRPALQLAATAAAPPPPAAAAAAHARPASTTGRPAATATAGGGGAAAAAAAAAAADSAASDGLAAPALLVPPEPFRPLLSILIHVQGGVAGEPQVPLELQANNTGRDARQRPVSELVCVAGTRRQWSDCVQGHIIALAGSSRLAAAATANGDLMVYSPAGRRLFPPIRLGHPASFLSVSAGGSVLLALLADGQLRIWDFAAGEKLLEASVAPLLMGGAQQGRRVAAVRLAASGAPVVVMGDACAYVYHVGLACWMRVADDSFPASAYTTNLASGAPGELSRLQTTAAQRRHPHDVLAASAASAARVSAAVRSEQAALEHNLAAAAVLQSPVEWRLWLTVYVRRLAADGDESRLRDLISEFMGPVRFDAATHGGGPAAGPSGANRTGGAATPAAATAGSPNEPPLASSLVGRWQPTVLGADKRRLLREVVLKEVAKNRAFQQLVAEVLDQLKYVEGATQVPGPRGHSGAAATAGAGTSRGGGAGGSTAGPDGGSAAQGAGLHQPQPQPHQPMVLG